VSDADGRHRRPVVPEDYPDGLVYVTEWAIYRVDGPYPDELIHAFQGDE